MTTLGPTLAPPWPADPAGDQLVEHLKLIQAVITRQNHSAFVVKGWSVTLTGAIIAYAVSKPEVGFLAFAGVLTSAICWWLDAHFLDYERRFRCLYKAVHQLKPVPPFSMDPDPWVEADYTSVEDCAQRNTVRLVHLPLFLASVIAGFVLICR